MEGKMPYLVDGHNLIPHIPGLSLQDMDDEEKLLNLLADFARSEQVAIEVYFDRAAAGHVGTRVAGRLKAIFVSTHTIADDQIIKRIHSLGGSVKNWTMVTSDRRIQAEAKRVRASLLDSETFARQMLTRLANSPNHAIPDPTPSTSEVEEWLKIFGENK